MPQVQLRRFEQIQAQHIGRVVARTGLSDVSDTSGVKNVLAADAREQDQAYFQMTRLRDLFDLRTAAGEDLDERVQEIAPGDLQRIQAQAAIGNVVFGRTGTTGTVTIASGTVVQTSTGTLFRTTRQGQITAGSSTSGDVPVIAAVPGIEGNVAAGAISGFASKPAGVDTVSNGAALTQGRDKEADSSFRQRALNYTASLARSTVAALEFVAVGLQDATNGRSVVFAHVFEDPVDRGLSILYIDDGAGTAAELGTPVTSEVVIASALGGEEFLQLDTAPVDLNSTLTIVSGGTGARGTLTLGTDYYLDPTNGRLYFTPALSVGESISASYTPFINLIATVQKVINGDPADRVNFPGYRAAGTQVRVLSPTVAPIQVQGVLTVDGGRAEAVAAAEAAVQDYINNAGISADIIRNEIIDRIMGVDGVIDVDLQLPATNLTILDDQIARVTTASLLNLS